MARVPAAYAQCLIWLALVLVAAPLVGAEDGRAVHPVVFFGFGVLDDHQAEQAWLLEKFQADLTAHGATVLPEPPAEGSGSWLIQAVVSMRPGLDDKPAVHVTLTCEALTKDEHGTWWEQIALVGPSYDRVRVLDQLHGLLQQARAQVAMGR